MFAAGPPTAIVTLSVPNNATWQDAFQFGTPGDLTWNFNGQHFHMDIKKSRWVATPLFSLTTENGRIVVDDPIQRVLHFNVVFTDLEAALVPGHYEYDFIMIDASNPPIRVPLMAGKVYVGQGVTQE